MTETDDIFKKATEQWLANQQKASNAKNQAIASTQVANQNKTVTSTSRNIVNDITSWLGDTAANASRWVSTNLDELAKFGNDVIKRTSTIGTEIVKKVDSQLDEFGGLVNEGIDGIDRFLAEQGIEFKQLVNGGLNNVTSSLASLANLAVDTGIQTIDAVKERVNSLGGTLSTAISDGVSSTLTALDKAFTKANQATNSLIQSTTDRFNTTISQLKSQAKQQLDTMAKSFDSVSLLFMRGLHDITKTLTDAFSLDADKVLAFQIELDRKRTQALLKEAKLI